MDAAHELVTCDLGHEGAHRLLMRSFARQQLPHRALRQFELCRRELAEHFDLVPGPDTAALVRAIRLREAV